MNKTNQRDLHAVNLISHPAETPLITVVTVVRNGVDTMEETILSVLRQSYKNIEYLVIDGGSTDGTLAIIQKYTAQIKSWISEPDKGIYDAMNKALKIATGDFLIFLNAGDTFFSDLTIQEFISKIQQRDVVYYGDALYRNQTGGEEFRRGGLFSKYRLSKTNICHQTIFYPNIVYQSNFYNLNYKISADWAYNIRLFRKYKYMYLEQVVACYDTNGISAQTRDLRFARDQKFLFLRYLGPDTLCYILLKKMKDILFPPSGSSERRAAP